MAETVDKVHELEIGFATLASFFHDFGEDESMSEEGVESDPYPLPSVAKPAVMPGPVGHNGAPEPCLRQQCGATLTQPTYPCPSSGYGQQGADAPGIGQTAISFSQATPQFNLGITSREKGCEAASPPMFDMRGQQGQMACPPPLCGREAATIC